jgi:putative PIN family toxin of toxin-antitoxin system
LISNRNVLLDKLLVEENTTLIFSQELLSEFIEVPKRPKFHKYFVEDDLLEILGFIYAKSHFIQITTDINICRDKKDNFLLSLAVDGSADYIITGDKDLLDLREIEGTRIVTIGEFQQLLKQK